MPTTVTLDPGVEALLRSAMKQRGPSFKEALNSAIRAGLTTNGPGRCRFVQRTFSLGAEQNFRWDKNLAFADALEDELTRKLLAQNSVRRTVILRRFPDFAGAIRWSDQDC